MAYTNMFDNSEKTLSGKVVVNLFPNGFDKNKKTYYAKVVRNTAA